LILQSAKSTHTSGAGAELLQAFFIGNGKFPTTLFPATSQQFATVFRRHTFTETVFVFAGAT
jgi:hypothetical protein